MRALAVTFLSSDTVRLVQTTSVILLAGFLRIRRSGACGAIRAVRLCMLGRRSEEAFQLFAEICAKIK